MNINEITTPTVDTTVEVCGTSTRANAFIERSEAVDVNRHRPEDYATLTIDGTRYLVLVDAAGWPHFVVDSGDMTYLDGSVRRAGRNLDVEVGQKLVIGDHHSVYTIIDGPAFARC